jgi:hypothetical protein
MHTDQQPPEQLQQVISDRFAMVCFLAAGGTLERAQELCADINREIDDALPVGEVYTGRTCP